MKDGIGLMIDQKIKKYFDEADISISARQINQLSLYYRLIIENNDDNDLTRIKGEDQFIIKHFVDSVYCTKFLTIPESIIDIGTGAGFPGIPLKIMNPGIRLILAEQRGRRVEFLKLAVDSLKLDNVEFYPHKVTEKSFFNVNGVITRALEDAPETLSRVEHFIPEGGVVIFLKGPDAAGDILSLTESNRKKYNLELDKSYKLPGTAYLRRILLFRKRQDTFRKIYKIMKNENETNGVAITSEDNKLFKEIRKVASGDGIRKSAIIAIAGQKIISDFLTGKKINNFKLILPDDYSETNMNFDSIITSFNEYGSLYIMKKSLFNELEISSGKSPVLIVPLPEINEWNGTIETGCTPVIPFQDPLNVGSAVRSAAGFGIKKILLSSDAANPYHPKSIRSSSGAVFEVEFMRGPSLKEILLNAEKSGIEMLALDKNGSSIFKVEFPERFMLIPGIEGPGLPDDFRNKSISIPLHGKIESLNASVALSIFMYEWRKKIDTGL